MSDINQRIAEWLGWRLEVLDSGLLRWYGPDGEKYAFMIGQEEPFPRYNESLDDCALFEADLKSRNMELVYSSHLSDLMDDGGILYIWELISATPEQRCSAFLMTIGEYDAK